MYLPKGLENTPLTKYRFFDSRLKSDSSESVNFIEKSDLISDLAPKVLATSSTITLVPCIAIACSGTPSLMSSRTAKPKKELIYYKCFFKFSFFHTFIKIFDGFFDTAVLSGRFCSKCKQKRF